MSDSINTELPLLPLSVDFNTEPLCGLGERPFHLMSSTERSAHVLKIRQMRQSAQVFKQETEVFEKVRVEKKTKEPKKVSIDDLEALF